MQGVLCVGDPDTVVVLGDDPSGGERVGSSVFTVSNRLGAVVVRTASPGVAGQWVQRLQAISETDDPPPPEETGDFSSAPPAFDESISHAPPPLDDFVDDFEAPPDQAEDPEGPQDLSMWESGNLGTFHGLFQVEPAGEERELRITIDDQVRSHIKPHVHLERRVWRAR